MTISEIKRRRAELLAMAESNMRYYLGQQRQVQERMEELQAACPHDGHAIVCEVCGALIDGAPVASVE
jgi:hypothetical protein